MEGTATRVHAASGVLTIYTLPMLVFCLSVLLTFCLGGLILSMLAGLHLGDTLRHPDPFFAYEALWPGQSIESAAAVIERSSDSSLSCISWNAISKFHPIVTTPESEPARSEISCTGFPKDGVFSTMGVSIEKGQVQVLRLTSKVLQQDMLFLYSGAPDLVKQSTRQDQWVLQWNRSSYQATALVQASDAVVEDLTLLKKN